MDEQQRRLRRAAAEEFMRSLEQLGEMLDEEATTDEVADGLPAKTQAEAALNSSTPLRLSLDFGTSQGRRPSNSNADEPSTPDKSTPPDSN